MNWHCKVFQGLHPTAMQAKVFNLSLLGVWDVAKRLGVSVNVVWCVKNSIDRLLYQSCERLQLTRKESQVFIDSLHFIDNDELCFYYGFTNDTLDTCKKRILKKIEQANNTDVI